MSVIDDKNRHHDETKVRRWLERSNGTHFHETTWDVLIADGYVRDYLDGLDDMAREELERSAKDALDRQRRHEREVLDLHGLLEESDDVGSEGTRGTPRRVSLESVFGIELPEREQRRAAVLLEIQMRQAAEHPDVLWFRGEHLGGRLLSADEAEGYFTPGVPARITDQRLERLARVLGREHGWHREDAAWFVLTAEPPTLRPVAVDVFINDSIHSSSYCKITLHVAPWVPPEEVEKAFVRMREQVHGGPGTVGEQRLEVLRFVETESAKRGQRPRFKALLQMWNRAHPYWQYGDYRAFSKAYREAYKEVAYPEYHPPHRAKTPNMERRERRNQI